MSWKVIAVCSVSVAAAAACRQSPTNPTESRMCAGFMRQPSYIGDCGARPAGTICLVFSDGYKWLIEDTAVLRCNTEPCIFPNACSGNTLEIASGVQAEYHHIHNTELVKRVARN